MAINDELITIKQVAKRANVSVGTVDRVLHNRGRVASQTAARVREILRSVNYQPNPLARSLANIKVFRFGVLMPQLSRHHHYWEHAMRGIDRAADELRIYKIEVIYFLYDGYSDLSFLAVSHQALQADLDGLVIVPIMFTQSAADIVKKIPRKLPFVFFNSRIPDTHFLTYIGQDSYQSGMLAANIMVLMTRPPGTAVVLTPVQDDLHISKRQQGFIDYMANHSGLAVKVYGPRNTEDRHSYFRILDQVFRENDDIVGIYATNAMIDCVAEYLQQHPGHEDARLIGHDLTEENIRYLKMGSIHFLIGQRPEMQGYEAIYALYRHIVMCEAVKPNLMMPLDVITQSNVDYFCGADDGCPADGRFR